LFTIAFPSPKACPSPRGVTTRGFDSLHPLPDFSHLAVNAAEDIVADQTWFADFGGDGFDPFLECGGPYEVGTGVGDNEVLGTESFDGTYSFEEAILEVAQHLFGFGFPLLPVRIAFDFIIGFLGMPFLHTLFGFCNRGKAFDKMPS